MHCPYCSFEESKVIDSRLVTEGSEIRRRRECLKCGERWTTFEVGELVMPKIIKQDKSRVPFDETKIREGIARPCYTFSNFSFVKRHSRFILFDYFWHNQFTYFKSSPPFSTFETFSSSSDFASFSY